MSPMCLALLAATLRLVLVLLAGGIVVALITARWHRVARRVA